MATTTRRPTFTVETVDPVTGRVTATRQQSFPQFTRISFEDQRRPFVPRVFTMSSKRGERS